MPTILLYGLIYLAVIAFVVGCVIRAVQYAKMPVHLRWELYPVPHEEASRVEHGGSYFEEVDWWKKPAHFNLAGEMSFMVPEMLFLKGLWEYNRKLWSRSFPFHFGLYLLIGSAALLVAATVVSLARPAWMAGSLAAGWLGLCRVVGLVGSVLVVLGSLGLLGRRLTDDDMKNFTTPGDIFNLLFFTVTCVLLLAGYMVGGKEFPGMLAFARGLLTFSPAVQVPGLLAAGMICGALLAAYIPYTHMSHFIAKYFTYHCVRWDDRVEVRGGELARRVAEYLTYRPTWSASHMGADGVKTWVDIATANPALGTKK
jgi:nitrate reductase gamma subunit